MTALFRSAYMTAVSYLLVKSRRARCSQATLLAKVPVPAVWVPPRGRSQATLLAKAPVQAVWAPPRGRSLMKVPVPAV